MKKVNLQPKAHIYVCTNDRAEKSCCRRVGGQEFLERMKVELTEKGLRSSRWITRSGCLGFCNDIGCVVCIYHQGQTSPILLTEVTAKDYRAVWDYFVEKVRDQ